MTVNWSTGGTMNHPGFAGKTEPGIRGTGWATSSSSWADVTGLVTNTSITVMRSTSIIMVFCELSTESDGAAGHGLARIRRSLNGGSWVTVANFNIMGSLDNLAGGGFCYPHDHNQSAGTQIKYKVQYRKTNTTGNHTIADTGPGEGTSASLFYWEQQYKND